MAVLKPLMSATTVRVPGAGSYTKEQLRRLLPPMVDLSPCGKYYMLADYGIAHHVGCPDDDAQAEIFRMIRQAGKTGGGWEGIELARNPTSSPDAFAEYVRDLRTLTEGRKYHPLCTEWKADLPDWLVPR